jgi:hypothetical protein
MNIRGLLISSITISAAVFMFTDGAVGGCGGKHAEKQGGKHDYGRGDEEGSGVGVGVSADLSGIGRRKREPDPFAVNEGSSTSQTRERHRPKKKKTTDVAKSNPFDDVKLTGKKAKDVAASENSSATALPKN